MFATTTDRASGSARRLFRLAGSMCAALALMAGLASSAQAGVRFTDGTFAEDALRCGTQYAGGYSSNVLQVYGYTSTSGVQVHSRWFVYSAGMREVNQWTSWSAWASRGAGGYLTPSAVINAMPDGRYLLQVEYAKLIGGVWQYRSQYVKVHQSSENPGAFWMINNLGSGDVICDLGPPGIIIVTG